MGKLQTDYCTLVLLLMQEKGEGNGNRNQMPSVPILINFGFPLKILIRN